MSSYRKNYLQSAHWRTFRLEVLAARPNCENCGLSRDLCRLFYLNDLDLHHLTYERLGKERPADVKVLCRACHEIAEIPKRWPEYMCFRGFPQFHATCPNCSRRIFLSIPHADKRETETGCPIYVAGEPYADGCDCCERDFYGFVEEHFEELFAERRAA